MPARHRCRSDDNLLIRTARPVGIRPGLVDACGFQRSEGTLGCGAATGSA